MINAKGEHVEYLYTEGSDDVPVPVRIEGIRTGEFRPVDGGWSYFAKGQEIGGKVFETLNACMYDFCGIPEVKYTYSDD